MIRDSPIRVYPLTATQRRGVGPSPLPCCDPSYARATPVGAPHPPPPPRDQCRDGPGQTTTTNHQRPTKPRTHTKRIRQRSALGQIEIEDSGYRRIRQPPPRSQCCRRPTLPPFDSQSAPLETMAQVTKNRFLMVDFCLRDLSRHSLK